MTIKRVLIIAPLFLILFLLQSYLWVPTYEQQTRGNPARLHEYIAASSGDASLLNPILSSDTTSGHIGSLVFESLIDRDEELRFRGRLATSWEVFEEAFFYVNESAGIPSMGKASPQELVEFLMQAKTKKGVSNPKVKASLDNIREISLIPPMKFTVTKSENATIENKEKIQVKVHVRAPARVKLSLTRVDQDLFHSLTQLLGRNYFSSFGGEEFLNTEPQVGRKKLVLYATELLPATEHNPVLVFHLRPDVQFHDGHIFDAFDVKFTYESIMNPRNLSPRIADYEPVKAVEVIDPLTIRIIYKRLYSPALGTWGMGIIPEHLLNQEA
ncbi:MAG: hypothetical protein JJE15_13635, partial [Desulfobacteraceae bacterium]|nr:hypothetical protein [Desulfobacteraceae bacterium]